jgi:RNA polymerase sigma factor for flagellar operon FliA
MTGADPVAEYLQKPTRETRDKVIFAYLPLVKYIVGRMNIPVDGVLKKEDLYQFGIVGLIEALNRFNPDSGVTFKTFSYKRIFGEIMDAVRRIGILNREQIKEVGRLEKITDSLRQVLQRDPSVSEICQNAEMSETEYYDLQMMKSLNFSLSLDDKIYDDEQSLTRKETIADEDTSSPEKLMDAKALKNDLKSIIRALPERERLVLALYYYEELTLADIGQVLNITESRVSQILKQTLINIKISLSKMNSRT